MKKVKRVIVDTIKVSLSMAAVFFAGFVILSGLLMGMDAVGLFPERGSEAFQTVKKRCSDRGGKWIVNPHSIIPHRIYGEGCNLDYIARAKK